MTRSNRSRLGIESFEDRLVPSSVTTPDVFLPIAVPVVIAGHGSLTDTGRTAAGESPTQAVTAAALNGLIDQARAQIGAEVATQVLVTVTMPSSHTSQGADTSSGARPSVDVVAVNRDFSAVGGPEGTAVATATSYSPDSLSTEIVSLSLHPDDANNPTSPLPAVIVPGPTEQAITDALAMHASTLERATVFTPTGLSDPPSNLPPGSGPRADWFADLAARITPISIGDRSNDPANPAPSAGSWFETNASATPPPPDLFFAATGLAALPPPEWLMMGINHGPNVDPNPWATQDVFRAANSRIVLANRGG